MAAKNQRVISHPLARSEQLLVEAVGDESVIYDERTHVAHALKPLAAAVQLHANGANSVADIAHLAGIRLDREVTESEVREAMAQLVALDLLEMPEPVRGNHGLSRRDALKVFGAAGAGTLLVSSIAAPFASADLSGDGAPYLCGTGTNPIRDASGHSTVSSSSDSKGWPQPYSNTSGGFVTVGQAGGPTVAGTNDHQLGSPCVVVAGSGAVPAVVGAAAVGTGAIYGTYQAVPCDGNFVGASYQCAQVVCVPSGVSVAGAIVSGSILPEAGDSKSDGGGYSPYTVSACQIWGTNYNGLNFCTDYPYKWCTNNPCVKTGTCKS